MKRSSYIIAGLGVIALVGVTSFAIADDHKRGKGWCDKGEYGQMHHGKGHGYGFMGKHHRMMQGDQDLGLTPERVKEIIEGKLAWHGNENLKAGTIETTPEGQIIAQLVTKEGSLVETFIIDPKTGAHQPKR